MMTLENLRKKHIILLLQFFINGGISSSNRKINALLSYVFKSLLYKFGLLSKISETPSDSKFRIHLACFTSEFKMHISKIGNVDINSSISRLKHAKSTHCRLDTFFRISNSTTHTCCGW